jgi:hypothetical protein
VRNWNLSVFASRPVSPFYFACALATRRSRWRVPRDLAVLFLLGEEVKLSGK